MYYCYQVPNFEGEDPIKIMFNHVKFMVMFLFRGAQFIKEAYVPVVWLNEVRCMKLVCLFISSNKVKHGIKIFYFYILTLPLSLHF